MINSQTATPVVAPTPSVGIVDVRTKGLSSYDRMYIGMILVMAILIYLGAFWAATTSPTRVPIAIPFVILTVFFVIFFLVMENLQGIRRVTVSDRGVAFGYLLHTKFALWGELSVSRFPQPEAAKRRGVYILRSITQKGQAGFWMHFVTRDQARAILTHPSCTIQEIELGVRAYLGL